MKKTLFAALFLILMGKVCAQGEANIWHFGEGQVVDFSSGAPVLGAQSSMVTFEGCMSICDAAGNLLFYSNGGGRIPALSGQDGGSIWNRNHDLMYDMTGTEGGGFSAVQSSVAIPKPGAPGRYFLFTMEEVEYNVGGSVPGQPDGRGLSYFEIDMSLNGGLGGVANYVESIYVPTYEGLCAVRHANGDGYWILVHATDGQSLVCFPVTAAGVGTPVVSPYGLECFGGIECSPDTKRLVVGRSDGMALFDFDPATGALSGLDTSITRYGQAEFSPNSRRLFLAESQEVYRYDLTAPAPGATEQLVGSSPNAQGGKVFSLSTRLQLGPDGRIYMGTRYGGSDNYLSAIFCPNGQNPVLQSNILTLFDSESGYFGLPNFTDHFFAAEDPPLLVSLGADQTLCPGASVALNAGNTPGWQYNWSNNASTASINVTQPGTYTVFVTDGCRVGADTVAVQAVALSVDAGDDQVVCLGTPAQLQGSASAGATLQWSGPGAVISDPTVADPSVAVVDDAEITLTASLSGCTLSDALLLTLQDFTNGSVSFADTLIDLGESVALLASGGSTYAWSPAAGLSCTDCPNPLASPSDTTVYTVVIGADGFCADTLQVTVNVRPPDCSVRIPNAFTPNGDGNNDSFGPVADYDDIELRVFSRWGELVYEGKDFWRGQDAPSDVYVYTVTVNICNEKKQYNGDVTLLR
jgi:gliding motility-associated-like protein